MKGLLRDLSLSDSEVKRILLGKKRKKPKLLKQRISNDSFKLGVIGDTHLCSKHEKLDELLTFYNICHKVGAKVVLHAGDVLAGWRIYKGQENEVHTFGAKGQAEYAIKNYPHVSGITTYFINGNHDDSWWKLAGVDTGELIAEKRKDMVYLGNYSADVEIGGILMRLHHGDGGGAYALSYKGQKLAEQIASKNKPRLLLMGHYHTAFYFWYRNMHILNTGCFEGQTSYLLRKGLNPAIGGWIVDVRTSNIRNDVLSVQPSWIPFF